MIFIFLKIESLQEKTWAMILHSFGFKVYHIHGSENKKKYEKLSLEKCQDFKVDRMYSARGSQADNYIRKNFKLTGSEDMRRLVPVIYSKIISDYEDLDLVDQLSSSRFKDEPVILLMRRKGVNTTYKFESVNIKAVFFLFAFTMTIFKESNIFNKLGRIKPTFQVNSGAEGSSYREIIFFPHKGVSYGKSHEKDYFFGKQTPLRREDLLYGEYNLSNNEQIALAQQYNSSGLNYIFFEKLSVSDAIRVFIVNFREVIGKLGFGQSLGAKLLTTQVLIVSYFYKEYIRRRLPKVKVALIGYDILFPKYLSYALFLNKIVTVAIQERLFVVGQKNYNVMIDYYIVLGEYSKRLLAGKLGCYVKNYFIMRPPRSTGKKRQTRRGLKNVLVFSNSVEVKEANRYAYLNEVSIVRELLESVLKLSRRCPDCCFTIRFKNIDNIGDMGLKQIISDINDSANIEISCDYSEFSVSNRLLYFADIVIGHHTSIIDEAISFGMPVIIYDGSPFSQTLYSSYISEYDDLFVYNHDELCERFLNIKDGDLSRFCKYKDRYIDNSRELDTEYFVRSLLSER